MEVRSDINIEPKIIIIIIKLQNKLAIHIFMVLGLFNKIELS